MNPKALIPSGISAFRIVALPLFLYFNSVGSASLCLLVFASAICTDLLDGFIARKLNVTSKTGAYFDAVSDFVFVAGIFLAFVLNGYYPVWLLLLIAGSFGQFAVTGYFAKRLYDPLGKYVGSVLYIGITLTLICPTACTFLIVQAGIIAFILTSFVTRTLDLAGVTKKSLIATQAKIQQANTNSAAKKP
ncbi:MAG: CDP-alcohol phosphatidyltransferase family protein [Candidatus Bathyarchaeia archaeon]|jgi:phosphatidylglycerophosphate synthase